MPADESDRLLTLNSGSASLTFAVYRACAGVSLVAEGELKRVRVGDGRFTVRDGAGNVLEDEARELPDFNAAYRTAFAWLSENDYGERLRLVSHRVVHGGTDRFDPEPADDALLGALRELVPLAPRHLPQALLGIERAREAYPHATHLACFDTAFHRDLPRVAQMLPLPHAYHERGLRRVGFHGLSYRYILHTLRQRWGADRANGRLLIAHLGGGASMAAVRGGRPVDTTMGLTPAGGLMMSTRSGDLDPGLVTHLVRTEALSAGDLNRLINEEAGLMGVSGYSGDLEQLLEDAPENEAAADAVALFCYTAKKHLGALCAVLGGLDALVFTGSVGTRAAGVRAQICDGLGFLGIRLDPRRNDRGEEVVSGEHSPVPVLALETGEEHILAQHGLAFLGEG